MALNSIWFLCDFLSHKLLKRIKCYESCLIHKTWIVGYKFKQYLAQGVLWYKKLAQGHHFQNLVPASWIPAGTSHFCSISLSRKVREVLSFSRTTKTPCKHPRVPWIAQRKPLRCFYSIAGVIINRRSITPRVCAVFLRPSGHLRGNQNSAPRALFSGVSGYLVLFGSLCS